MMKLNRVLKVIVCFAMIGVFTGCGSTSSPKQETAGQYVDDSLITTKVKADILKEPGLKTFDINLKTYNGVVQLSGFVDSAESAKKGRRGRTQCE